MGRRTFLRKEQRRPTLEELEEKISTELHSIPLDELVERLGTDLEKGLSSSHVESCLSRDGPNELTPVKGPLRLNHFTRHLRGITLPLVIAMLLCFISAAIPELQPMGSHSEDKVYLGVLLILSIFIISSFSFIVEKRSKQALDSLRKLYPQFATVIRNGQKMRIKRSDVVVGDVVTFRQGDFVPADVRISESVNLETDDSVIIETLGRRPKKPYHVKPDPLETENLAFSGTYCLKGYGKGVCIATGDQTVLRETLDLTVALDDGRTAIYTSIKALVHFLATATVCLGVILFVFSYHVGWFWLDTALYLLILVIANIPDSLLSGTTVSLVISAKRMASHNCLVKDLEAVENLGVITVICLGKRDVVTQNRHSIHNLWLDRKIFPININHKQPGNNFMRSELTFGEVPWLSSLQNPSTGAIQKSNLDFAVKIELICAINIICCGKRDVVTQNRHSVHNLWLDKKIFPININHKQPGNNFMRSELTFGEVPWLSSLQNPSTGAIQKSNLDFAVKIELICAINIICCGKRDVVTQNRHSVHNLWLDKKIFPININHKQPGNNFMRSELTFGEVPWLSSLQNPSTGAIQKSNLDFAVKIELICAINIICCGKRDVVTQNRHSVHNLWLDKKIFPININHKQPGNNFMRSELTFGEVPWLSSLQNPSTGAIQKSNLDFAVKIELICAINIICCGKRDVVTQNRHSVHNLWLDKKIFPININHKQPGNNFMRSELTFGEVPWLSSLQNPSTGAIQKSNLDFAVKIELICAINIICCGKRDVVTQNRHSVHNLWLDKKIFPININHKQPEVTGIKASPGWMHFVRAACLCNSTEAQSPFTKLRTTKEISDDSLEHATMIFLKKYDVDIDRYREKYTKVFEVPYDPNRNRFHVTIHEESSTSKDQNGSYVLSVKGAPDIIMPFCSSILIDGKEEPLSKHNLDAFRQTAEDLLFKGEVVVGYCDIEVPKNEFPDYSEFQTTTFPLKDLRFLGMISAHDPVRPSTVEAIRNLRNAGIKVMLLTGDHPILAKSLARQVGIIGESSETREELAERLQISVGEVEPGSVQAVVIHGEELDVLKDGELSNLLREYDEVVFARIRPEQKTQILKVCREMRHCVAITGKKFEDHEALKQADIGVSMGNSSCDLCNENANVLLLDRSFLTFVSAVKEGRLVFDNLRKSIAYVMTCKLSLIVPFFLLLTLNIPLPMGANLILLIFLGTDMFPALSLIYEKAENDIMHRTPQFLKEKNVVNFKFIQRLLHKSCFCLGIIISLASLYTYFIIMAENGFMPQDLLGIRKQWYSPAVNDLKDRFNQEWTYTARKELLYCSQTGFFTTVVVTQLFTLVVQKTSRESLLEHGIRNYALNFCLIFSLILTLICCYVPGLNFFLHTYPIKFIWWLPGIPFGIFIFAYDETRNFIIRHSSPESWIATETY